MGLSPDNDSLRPSGHRRFRRPCRFGIPNKIISATPSVPKLNRGSVYFNQLQLKNQKTFREAFAGYVIEAVWQMGPDSLLRTRNVGIKGVAQFVYEVVVNKLATDEEARAWFQMATPGRARALLAQYEVFQTGNFL